jgi:hypothetical protein
MSDRSYELQITFAAQAYRLALLTLVTGLALFGATGASASELGSTTTTRTIRMTSPTSSDKMRYKLPSSAATRSATSAN